MATSRAKAKRDGRRKGKLRIGNHWNAISIIASSQANPLKAVAEFVENSIDAKARHIHITRGKRDGEFYLRVTDDGEGIPRNDDGLPDFHYVATHICDSIKRRLKEEGADGLQGEFGIGLLSFWTVGQNLTMTSSGADGNTYEMTMEKGSQSYTFRKKRVLLPIKGTDMEVYPILPGLRGLTGDKIQRYLSSELRDRIKESDVDVRVFDRTSRLNYRVEPREYSGQLLRNIEPIQTETGDIYLELYLNEPASSNRIGLFRRGTRVLPDITGLDYFQKEPWTEGYLQGIIEAPFLNLTPGTRQGIIHDAGYDTFCRALGDVEEQLREIIAEQRKAEEERSSRQILRKVQRALKEAFMRLPEEEYDWFDIQASKSRKRRDPTVLPETMPIGVSQADADAKEGSGGSDPDANGRDRDFFEYAGALFSVLISPKSSVVAVDNRRTYRAICRDRSKRIVWKDLSYEWEIAGGEGRLLSNDSETAVFQAPGEPGLTTLAVTARQGDIVCMDSALITISDSLIDQPGGREGNQKGLPGYTYRRPRERCGGPDSTSIKT